MVSNFMRDTGATAVSVAAILSVGLVMPNLASAQENMITIVLPEEPNSLDNCESGRSAVGRVLRQNINESLIELDARDGTLKPRLVTSWKQVDEHTWQFTLRQGITYSDGRPLTVQSIAKSFEKMMNPNLDCAPRTKQLAGLSLEFVEVDEAAGTFNIVTEPPEPILPIRLTTVTVGTGDDPDVMLPHSIGTGPYVLDEWRSGLEIVLKRNPDYWGTAPELDGATFVWRSDSAVTSAMVEVGEAHIAPNITQNDAVNPDMDFAYPNSETSYIRIESQVAPLDDRRVRLALNHAIDRQALHGTIIPEQAMIAVQMVIPRIAGHNHDLDKQRFAYDPEKARQLLAEAKADGVAVDTEIDIVGRINQWANTTETMEAVHAMLTSVGFNVNVQMIEVGQWQHFNANPNKGENTPASEAKIKERAPILLSHQHDNNIGDPAPSMYPKYACDAVASTHCWPALDAQIVKASQLSAGPDRVAAWKEAMRMIHEDYVADIFLYHMVGFARVHPSVNYTPTAATNSEILLEEITFK